MKNTEIIIQFIPIIIIFTLLKFSQYFVNFSFTILGKLIAILIIIFYSAIDIMVGLCVCGLVILYYQSDYVENMLNISDLVEIDDIIDIPSLEMDNDIGIPDDGMYLVPMATANNMKKTRQTKGKQTCKNKCEGMTDSANYKPDLIEQFKKENCVGGELKYKDMTVKKDMAEHVFSELAFDNRPCNACNNTCKYSIIESKIKTEEQMTPISTSQ